MVKLLDLNSLESIIFTQIKARFSSKIKSKYKDLTFTTEEESKTTPKFPNVYVYLMPGIETELTLERTAIEGGLFTFQIKVTDNQNQTRVKEVMGEIIKIMKSLSFYMVAMPAYENTKDTYWSTARFRRQIDRYDYL